MADENHVAILKQGVDVWNKWRKDNPDIRPSLSGAELSGLELSGTDLFRADLYKANLSGANLFGSRLTQADLFEANLAGADLRGVTFHRANLMLANLVKADLRVSDLAWATLSGSHLRDADLSMASLRAADLRGADLSMANLNTADLSGAILVNTNLSGANLSGCFIFGISAWKLNIEGAIQSDLIITREDEPVIRVDNIEIAQFIYLLLHNEILRTVIDTLTTKSVLILGRFTDERKAVLDAVRDELRRRGYIPILFDFQKSANRDLTETVMTLASLSRFVIADLSDPNSIPHELMSFAQQLLSVPIQGIFCPVKEHPNPYPMYEHLRRYPHVLPIYRYETAGELIPVLGEKVIAPAEAKVKEMRPGSI